jgi:hypothetical protein
MNAHLQTTVSDIICCGLFAHCLTLSMGKTSSAVFNHVIWQTVMECTSLDDLSQCRLVSKYCNVSYII